MGETIAILGNVFYGNGFAPKKSSYNKADEGILTLSNGSATFSYSTVFANFAADGLKAALMPFNYGLATIGGVFIVVVMLASLQHASRYKSSRLRVISHCYKVFLGVLAICMTPYLSVTSTVRLYKLRIAAVRQCISPSKIL